MEQDEATCGSTVVSKSDFAELRDLQKAYNRSFSNSTIHEAVMQKRMTWTSDADQSSISDTDSESDDIVYDHMPLKAAERVASMTGFGHTLSGGSISEPDDVSPELIRGVRLSDMLSIWIGKASGLRLWYFGLDALTTDCKKAHFSLSKQTDEFDAFITHTWSDAGFQKYVYLLLHNCWSGFFASIALLALLVLSSLVVSATSASCPQEEGRSAWFSLLLLISVPFAGLVGLLVGPIFPQFMRQNPFVFIDAFCIDQSDEQQKLAGILALEGIIRRSKELHIILTPNYFSRLWCVFELAAFLRLNPEGNIHLRAPSADKIPLLAFFGSWVCTLLYAVLISIGVSQRVVVLTTLLPCFVMMKQASLAIKEKKDLMEKLEHFDVLKDCDRLFILRRIRRWFGTTDNFNSYVHKKVVPEMTKLVENQKQSSYLQVLLCLSISPLCYYLPQLLSCCAHGFIH